MSDKPGRRYTTNFKTPAMKKWQRDHLKQEDDEPANKTGEIVTGFFVPTFAAFSLFMVVGTSTADDPWGEVAAMGFTMISWPIISLIFILYYNSKRNENRMKGAINSFIASLGMILIVVVFGGILQS